MGSIPDYYNLFVVARYLHINPWDMIRMPIEYTDLALAAKAMQEYEESKKITTTEDYTDIAASERGPIDESKLFDNIINRLQQDIEDLQKFNETWKTENEKLRPEYQLLQQIMADREDQGELQTNE